MFGRDSIQPSVTRHADYDSGHDSPHAAYPLLCASCGYTTAVAFAELTSSGLAYERHLGAAVGAAVLAHFGVGVVGKSHDGGWPALLDVHCKACSAAYLVYAGVSEPCNGRLVVTVQGVVERVSALNAG